MATLTDLYNTRPTYGTNMPTIQPTPDPAAGALGTGQTPWNADMINPAPALDQAGYFAQNPNAGFGDYLNYTQRKTPAGEFQAPASLPPGFLQSDYGPAYNSVLAQFSDPNYNRNEDQNNLSALMTNWAQAYAGGRSYADWQNEAAKSAQGTPLIGGGRYALDAPSVGQLALGGFGGAAMGAGVGGGGTATAGGAVPAVTGDVVGGAAPGAAGVGGGAAPTLGQVGTAASLAGTAANTLGDSQAVSPPLGAAQDPLGSGGDPGNAVSGPGASGGAAGAGSALSRIIDGTATTADWTSVLGGAAGTALGIAGSVSQQNALQDLANKQMAMGAPYRDRLASLYADPNSFLKSAEVTTPVQQGTDALARSLSVQGNPIGSGHALQELQDYSANQLFGKLGQEKDRLAGYGGLTAYNAAAPGTALAGVNAGSNVWNAVGSGIANLTNPQPSLVDLFKTMKGLA